MCHETSGPPTRNAFGADVALALATAVDTGTDFDSALPDALLAVQDLDSDGDGLSNLQEITAGSWPGFSESIEQECLPQTQTGNDSWRVGQYDPFFAWRRVTLDFCGRSPRYEEVSAFEQALAQVGWGRGDDGKGTANQDPAVMALIQAQLDACLQSPYWTATVNDIAIGVVRPKGYNSDVYLLGNYDWDLRLFRYATSGDRDAADLMQAKYLVVEEPVGSGLLQAVDEPRNETEAYAQPLAAEDRYGLITTRHSLAMNVMFADVPRTLAAQWYRELLGLDISLSEGLYPIDEVDGAFDWPAPRDVDGRGVWQEECAGCHTTLDPLSYPWARYNGIDLEGDTTATLVPDRATDILPDTAGYIFGVPVSGPQEWVDEAVASDAFSERVVELFWTWIFRREPYSCEAEQWQALWQGFRDGSYDQVDASRPRVVQEMLHQLVLLDAYGVP